MSTQTDFDSQVTLAHAAATAYYNAANEAVSGDDLMSDAEYDDLVGQIEAALELHPEWANEKSHAVLNMVAGGTAISGDVTHLEPMLSLTKVVTTDDVNGAIAKFGAVIIEPKLDGLAVRAVYEGGRLVQVVTRGDGLTGEDITERVLSGKTSRVLGLPADVVTGDFEVRGEVFMSDADFEFSNRNRTEAGKPAFVNQRNGAAGALRKADATYDTALSFAAYDVTGYSDEPNYSDRMTTLLTGTGIKAAMFLTDLPRDPRDAMDHLDTHRATLGYPIDGCVIKADADTIRRSLGMGSRAPKWAVAYKYEAEAATTVVHDIELALGRTGRLSLRARVEPTFVGGTTVTYASLHNVGWLIEQDIRIGDTVVVKRANDVIPRVESPDLSQRPAGSVAWVPPTGCPQCGEPFDKSTELWRCVTPECSTLGRITYAAARDCLDIEGMSTAVATALVETGRVSNIADLFTLTTDELTSLVLGTTKTGSPRRLGASNATKISAEIERAKTQPLNRVITSLGMRKTGRTMGRRLANQFGTMEALRTASVEALCEVEGVATGKAQSIHDEVRAMATVIDALAVAGVNMGTEVVVEDTAPATGTNALDGMSVVVTGKVTGPLAGLSRNDMNELIEAHGGKASGSVSAKTGLLVCAEPSGTKFDKATALGVTIVTPEKFAALIGR